MSNKIAPNINVGVREKNKLAAISLEITEHEKEARKLLAKTARSYYDAGNILSDIIKRWPCNKVRMSDKAISDATDFPERRIGIALKIFKHFENNPDVLKSLALRDALKLIAPPPPAGEEGYNRVDLGGDPGRLQLGYDELFELPATGNLCLQNYRTVGDLLSEIIVVKRTKEGSLTSKSFARFGEDVPQEPVLRDAYIIMSQKTQSAIEDYLVALEQKEVH